MKTITTHKTASGLSVMIGGKAVHTGFTKASDLKRFLKSDLASAVTGLSMGKRFTVEAAFNDWKAWLEDVANERTAENRLLYVHDWMRAMRDCARCWPHDASCGSTRSEPDTAPHRRRSKRLGTAARTRRIRSSRRARRYVRACRACR